MDYIAVDLYTNSEVWTGTGGVMTETSSRKAVPSWLQWIIFMIVLYMGLGCFVFPGWWRDFIFEGGILSSDQWLGGIGSLIRWLRERVIFRLLLQPVELVIVGAIIVAWRLGIKHGFLKKLEFRKEPSRKVLGSAGAVLISGLAWSWVTTLDLQQIPAIDSLASTEVSGKSFSLDEVRDFAFIDAARVASVFSQIPGMQLSEIETEQSAESSLEGEAGIENVASVKGGTTRGRKSVERYTATQLTPARQISLILKHYNDRRELTEYESLELDSERLRSLKTLSDLLTQYEITHDTRRLEAITRESLQQEAAKQRTQFESVRNPIIVRGTFRATPNGNTIELSHPFFVRENMIAIRFIIEPFDKSDPNVLSPTIRRLTGPGESLLLSVFGKVVSAKGSEDELRIVVSPYAIWHL